MSLKAHEALGFSRPTVRPSHHLCPVSGGVMELAVLSFSVKKVALHIEIFGRWF
jgi:hypothetical protein